MSEDDEQKEWVKKAFCDKYTDAEQTYINDVLASVHKRSLGAVHASWDFDTLVKYLNEGKTPTEVTDEVFDFMKKVESGEISTTPYTDYTEDTFLDEESHF